MNSNGRAPTTVETCPGPLAEHPLEPCFEYRAGTLVVYLERRLADAGRLGWLLDATEEIAVRFAREVAEATAGAAA